MSLILPHLLRSSLGLLTEALADLMTAAETGTDPALPWAGVEAVTHPRPTTTTTTVADRLVATAPAATTTADAHLLVSFMIDVMEDMDARLLVAACLMSMAHRVRVTLTILMMLGPDLHLVATMIPT